MSLIVFFMINFVGDPVDMLVNPESLPEEIERVRKDFGLDQPVHVQYWKFLQGAINGNLGNSFRNYSYMSNEIILFLGRI